MSAVGQKMRERIGLSAALATPFDAEGQIDWPRFASHASSLLDGGMTVVTAFGTTGEGISISARTRAELYDRLSTHGIAPDRLVECVYGPSVADAAIHVRRSLSAGCAGILLTPPFYYKDLSEEGVYRWFSELFETVGTGCRDIILYNIPGLTGVPIGPSLVGRLRAAFPGVVAGVKDSGGNWNWTASLLAEHRDIAILVGHEGHLARAVRHGASGAISGVANFAPALVGRLVAGEDDSRIDALLRDLLSLPVVPAIKAILAARSGDESWRRTLAPLDTIVAADARAICATIARDFP
jgi:4-hydroxy-tetrahydrodipicolinate synthase